MKKWIIAASIALASASVLAQNYNSIIQQARSALNKKDYKTASAQFQLAFAQQQDNYADLYDAACVAALTGDRNRAFEWLDLSIESGWLNLEHLKEDSDLVSLHADPRWKKTVARLQTKLAEQEKKYDQKLKAQLEQIFYQDQNLRNQLATIAQKSGYESEQAKVLWKQIDEKDALNFKAVEAILAEHGWLGPKQVGSKASEALFAVIQHADKEARRKYVPMMREAVKEKKARADSLALMEDRIALESGEKQIYGSQLSSVDGKMALRPTEDPDHLDERRAAIGMSRIADYVANWKLEWDLNAFKKRMAIYDAEQILRSEDFKKFTDVLWRGELRYLDYSKNIWVSIPSNLRVSQTPQDPAVWLWSYGYDDEPHANAKDGVRLSQDGKKLGEEQIVSRMNMPDGGLRIVTKMSGQDDNRPAQFRFTYTIKDESFERKKEVKLVNADDYFVRHVYSWKR
ncbi:DUF6624 domain-containing protein [Undibacterium sp. Di24W]|uniref:DUF6624 domain-containing protein n=1 Tax=Undibacterium sp. Di24W TaxID=3413033 RepID=UPI003BF2E1D4